MHEAMSGESHCHCRPKSLDSLQERQLAWLPLQSLPDHMCFTNLCRSYNAIGIHTEELLLPSRALKLNLELFLLYPGSYNYWSLAIISLLFFPYMQLLSIILPAPEAHNDGTRLCPCYNMNFSPKLATKQVSSIYSFTKVVSNNGMPVPHSQ